MAISTIKISDTQEWCKRLSFGRRSNISNALEPALSSANMILGTILGPPFDWWWNTEDIVFTCNPTLKTATVTNVALTSNVVTIQFTAVTNLFSVGETIIPAAISVASFLNGQALQVLTSSSTQITANFTHADVASAANTGTLTATTTQDYTSTVTDFSHIDNASIFDINQTPSKWYELTEQNNLSLDSVQGRPRYINPLRQDAAGNMTFRLMPAPNLAYPVQIHVQKAPPLLTSVNSTWAPIPDYMQYVYNWGMLALIWMFADDARTQYANQKFQATLLGRAEGLTEMQRSIFLNNWHSLTGLDQMKATQGVQARGV